MVTRALRYARQPSSLVSARWVCLLAAWLSMGFPHLLIMGVWGRLRTSQLACSCQKLPRSWRHHCLASLKITLRRGVARRHCYKDSLFALGYGLMMRYVHSNRSSYVGFIRDGGGVGVYGEEGNGRARVQTHLYLFTQLWAPLGLLLIFFLK